MLEIFLSILASFITIMIILAILYIPLLSEARDEKLKRLYVHKSSKYNLDQYEEVKFIMALILCIPITLSTALLINSFGISVEKVYFDLSKLLITLSLSTFSLILFIDFFKGNENTDFNNYLASKGYHICINIMKKFVLFFFINMILSCIDIGLDSFTKRIFQFETILLFFVYLFYFFSCLKHVFMYRIFMKNKFSEIIGSLYQNYLNRPKITINVKSEKLIN